jgi:hypothetical protein
VQWRGVRFRSTLEARWARVWQALRLEWEYERRPLCSGLYYLPDFWLPFRADGGLWVEIKPKAATQVEERKCARLAQACRENVFLLAGEPQRFSFIEWDPAAAPCCWGGSQQLFPGYWTAELLGRRQPRTIARALR